MDNKEILLKAILKAEETGYKYYWQGYTSNHTDIYCDIAEKDIKNPSIIIFSHDFAKAFWGENKIQHADILLGKTYDVSSWVQNNFKRWEYHLQQMVLCEEPLKYLEKFL